MSELITKYDPRSPISEVFRLLRTNIQYINKDEKSTAIMLTSTTPANTSLSLNNPALTLARFSSLPWTKSNPNATGKSASFSASTKASK